VCRATKARWESSSIHFCANRASLAIGGTVVGVAARFSRVRVFVTLVTVVIGDSPIRRASIVRLHVCPVTSVVAPYVGVRKS